MGKPQIRSAEANVKLLYKDYASNLVRSISMKNNPWRRYNTQEKIDHFKNSKAK